MLKNFVLTILRNTLRDKTYLILNVLGLTLGITGSILIFLFVRNELSYENFHKASERIYRINIFVKMEGKEFSAAVTAPIQARIFKAEFPEIENSTRYYNTTDQKVTVNSISYHESNFFYSDPEFFEMFNFPLLTGNPKSALKDPFTVILTQKTALKLFGTEDVLGKNIILNNDQVYRITGIAKDIPGNTHFRFDYLASMNSLELSRSDFWLSQMLETFIQLKEGHDYKDLQSKFEGLMDKYVMPQVKAIIPGIADTYKEYKATGNVFEFPLQPLNDVHFNTNYIMGYGQTIDRIYIYFFSIVALFLICIACINFMNLATARYAYRTREVGVKKVLGSTRSQLMRQFLIESTLISLIAIIIALTIIELVLPAFSNFTGKSLSIGYFSHWYAIPSIILLTLLIGILSGLYPAFYLSSIKPTDIFKSRFNGGSGKVKLRSALVIVQFTITIILLISTFIILSQLTYIRNKNLGFNKDNVLVVKNTGDLGEQSETFRQQTLKLTGVAGASRSWTYPGEIYYGTSFQMEGDSLNKVYHFEIIQGDYDFVPALGMEIVAGRNFSPDFSTDVSGVLINERAVDFLRLKDPVGTRFTTPNRQGGYDVAEVIGVFRNVYYKSLHEAIEPTMLGLNTSHTNNYTMIKIKSNDIRNTVKEIEELWLSFLPGQPFEYSFIDEHFDTLYKSEIQAGRIFGFFSILAIFIACLGLLGLSSFTAAKRTKEIGIRKVHGASIPMILRLLSKETVVLICVSSIIAWPIVYYIMLKWLQNFAYQTTIKLWFFPVASAIGLFIAIAVVVYQSLRVAGINPVEALKYE